MSLFFHKKFQVKIQSVLTGVPQPHTMHTHSNLGFGAQQQNTLNLGTDPKNHFHTSEILTVPYHLTEDRQHSKFLPSTMRHKPVDLL